MNGPYHDRTLPWVAGLFAIMLALLAKPFPSARWAGKVRQMLDMTGRGFGR